MDQDSTTAATAGGDENSPLSPPWAWIKYIRDLTDPTKTSLLDNDYDNNVDLPVEIAPWLWLSDRKSAMDVSKLKARRITHILSVHAVPPREEAYYQERLNDTNIIHKRISCDDTEGYDMLGRHWNECLAFLSSVKNTPDSRVVVHCVAGINRSGFVACAAYMILEQQPILPTVLHCYVQRGGMLLWNHSFQ